MFVKYLYLSLACFRYELIEAEKAKKDIRKLVLPSHTHSATSASSSNNKNGGSNKTSPTSEAAATKAGSAQKEGATARPKVGGKTIYNN